MRNILRCRRGSAAFATVIAMIPLIGVLALGGEAGSWYVTRQHAQNAADAAAYSGALRLACTQAGQTGVTCSDTNSVDYRGKQFAAQNAFCNTGDTSYPGSRCLTTLPSGTSQSVTIAQLTSWNGNSGSFVQATVTQQQRTYLAKVLGMSTVTMGAVGTAQVVVLANPCVLTLTDPIAFQGATTVSSPNCGIASNSTAQNSVDFTGNGLNVTNIGSISGQGGCTQTGGTQCSKAVTYAPAVPNPLSGLDTAISSLTTSDFSDGVCATPSGSSPIALPAYGSPKKCYYDGSPFQNNNTYTLNGIYFFADGQIRIQGNTTIKGTGTLILLPPGFVKKSDPGASLNITGNPTIQITAPTTVTASQVPTKLSTGTTSVLSLMSSLLIYDPEPYSKNGISITGSTSSYFSGITYVPNTPVTYTGGAQSSTCTEVIAYAVTFSGSSSFDNSGCPASVKTQSKYARMVP